MGLEQKVMNSSDDVLLHDFSRLGSSSVGGEVSEHLRKYSGCCLVLNGPHQEQTCCLPVVVKSHSKLVHQPGMMSQCLQGLSSLLL